MAASVKQQPWNDTAAHCSTIVYAEFRNDRLRNYGESPAIWRSPCCIRSRIPNNFDADEGEDGAEISNAFSQVIYRRIVDYRLSEGGLLCRPRRNSPCYYWPLSGLSSAFSESPTTGSVRSAPAIWQRNPERGNFNWTSLISWRDIKRIPLYITKSKANDFSIERNVF